MIAIPTIYYVVIILAAISVVAVIGWLFRKDDAIEERRRNMMKLFGRLQELGLDEFAAAAQAYVIGDYSNLYREAHQLLHTLLDPAKADAMLAKHFYNQLEHRLLLPSDVVRIKAAIEKISPVVAK
jgi:hypothetical protein